MEKKIKIYKEYIKAKENGSKTAKDVAKDFGITRSALYLIIKEVENGNQHKIKTCTAKSRLECLWEYKYKTLYEVLPKNQKPETMKKLREIISAMFSDKFNVSDISERLKKDRATVLYHLKGVNEEK